jgi:hypothetical protein
MSLGSILPTSSGYEIPTGAWYVSFMRIFAAVVCAASMACSNNDAPPADASTDTGMDAKPPDATIDTYVDPVAICKAEAARVANLCTGQRKCFFEKYADFCLLERNDVITKALKCFDTGCHTFADPGTMAIQACLTKVSTDSANMWSDKTKMAYCAKCATAPGCTGQSPFAIPFEHLSDSRNDQTAMCADNAADCAGADLCLELEFPDIYACYGVSADGGADAGPDATDASSE